MGDLAKSEKYKSPKKILKNLEIIIKSKLKNFLKERKKMKKISKVTRIVHSFLAETFKAAKQKDDNKVAEMVSKSTEIFSTFYECEFGLSHFDLSLNEKDFLDRMDGSFSASREIIVEKVMQKMDEEILRMKKEKCPHFVLTFSVRATQEKAAPF